MKKPKQQQQEQQREKAVEKEMVEREIRFKAVTVGSTAGKGSPNGVGNKSDPRHRVNVSRVRCGSSGSSGSSSSSSSNNSSPGGGGVGGGNSGRGRGSSSSGRGSGSSIDSGMGSETAHSLATGALNLRRIASPPPVMPPSACTTPSRSPRNGGRDAFMSPAASPWRGAALGFHDARSRAARQVPVESSNHVTER